MDPDELDALAEELPPDAAVDRAALERLRTVAHVLDSLVRIPGTDVRVGLDPVLGAIPGVGDVLSAGLSLYVVAESARMGVTYTTLVRMLANVTVDAAGGSLPVVGPVFDALWRANERNVALLIEDLAREAGQSEDEERERRERGSGGGSGDRRDHDARGGSEGIADSDGSDGPVVIEVEER